MAAERFRHQTIRGLRSRALAFPEVVEGDSCVKRSFKVRNKGLLYLGEKADEYNVMVKLGPSLEEASAPARDRPLSWSVGKGGWVILEFDPAARPPEGLLERRMEESCRRRAPKAPGEARDQR